MTERFAAWDQEHIESTVEKGSETLASEGSLGLLASSAEEQAARLEAMWNFEYTEKAETIPAETHALIVGKSVPLQRWRKFASIFEK